MFLQNCSCNSLSAESVIASQHFVIFASRGGLGGGLYGGLGVGLNGGLGGGLGQIFGLVPPDIGFGIATS